MNIYTSLNDDFALESPSAVCLGKFDGIHLGHRKLFSKVLESNLTPVVFTFTVPSEPSSFKYIYTQEEKISLLEGLKISTLYTVPFDINLMCIKPYDFIKKILIKKLNAKLIVVGQDFRFGNNREGDVEFLMKYAPTFGYEVIALDKLKKDTIVSSTRIRTLLQYGKIEEANELLGSVFFFKGRVVHGKKLGRTIGFPTANLKINPNKIDLKNGVYAGTTFVNNREYKSISNYGIRPTVDGKTPNLETYIYDFNEDIYDAEIIVKLQKFVRPEMKFSSVEELKNQIEKDKNSYK